METLEQEADYFGNNKTETINKLISHNAHSIVCCESFKAGAEWQKEQYKQLIELANEAANVCEDEGKMVTATNLRTEIERLQG